MKGKAGYSYAIKALCYNDVFMKKPAVFIACLLACASILILPDAAHADGRRDNQKNMRAQMASGEIKSRTEIEANIIPKMQDMRYLGFSYDADKLVYIFRFIKGERVVDIFVDARSGAILTRR